MVPLSHSQLHVDLCPTNFEVTSGTGFAGGGSLHPYPCCGLVLPYLFWVYYCRVHFWRQCMYQFSHNDQYSSMKVQGLFLFVINMTTSSVKS
jgi:hypothetical protein